MSATVTSIFTTSAVGYVEAMTETSALGWAWQPGQAQKLVVELRLGAQTVAQGIADCMRDDLAQSGIGDGRHAFSLSIPPELRERRSELSVVALLPDGEAFPLAPPPPAADANPDRLSQLHRGIEMLIGSQRLMHRNLQTALLRKEPATSAAIENFASAQERLRQDIESIELIVVRLEQALVSHQAAPKQHAAMAQRWSLMIAAVSSVALVASCIALWRTVLGG